MPVVEDDFSSLVCSADDVVAAIKQLKVDTDPGPDGLSAMMLKCCAPHIAEHLSALFNSSIATGKVSGECMIVRITPIYKKGESNDVSNYRPISLLSLVGKLLERIIHKALMAHVIANNIISSQQFGVRPGSSTQEALLSVCNFWHGTMVDGGSNVAVLPRRSILFSTRVSLMPLFELVLQVVCLSGLGAI